VANEDKMYTEWLRSQPCAMEGHSECIGAPHVHHATGRKGLGTRNHDQTGVCVCSKHHTERHALSGPFKGWRKQQIRDWEETTAARLRREYLGLGLEDSLEH
jgi:hypothetical protein